MGNDRIEGGVRPPGAEASRMLRSLVLLRSPLARLTTALSLGVVATVALAQLDTSPTAHRHKLKAVAAARPIAAQGRQFGEPLADLSPALTAAFLAGREEFESVETVESGLGPSFNGTSCVACHSKGATGGVGDTAVTRFGRVDTQGRFDPLNELGGSVLQSLSIDPRALEHVPAQANITALRMPTPLFGAGLIEAIPDDAILRNAARRHPEGIAGRAAIVTDAASGKTRVGRFGWKAQHATLLSFAADAYLNEMGITNRVFPHGNAPNGNLALLAEFESPSVIEDEVDPVTGKSDIDRAADFMRLLAPPPPARASTSALAGERIFEQIQCAACHVPTMLTGSNAIPALSNQSVSLYSDLLLHDMGTLGDGIAQGAAGQREMRTAPLWGLRLREHFLHDKRASSLNEAVRAHDGEASVARQRWVELSHEERRQILDFLHSL